eukprot:COSAG06_NODE_3120_length_5826_cov_11.100928_2_plen_462_part_00
MDAPLRLPDAFEHTDQQAAAEPQPLPKELRDDVQRLVALPRRLGRWGPGVSPLWCCSLGICSYGALTDVGAGLAAKMMVVMPPVLGLIIFAVNNRIAAVIVPHVLSQLSEARVSTKGTATLSKTMKGLKAFVGYLALLVGAISAVFAIESIIIIEWPKPGAPHQWVAAALTWIAAVLSIAMVVPHVAMQTMTQLAQDLTFLLATDTANQVAAEVQRATAATADYNGLAKRVYRVHRETVMVSEKMAPVIFLQASMLGSCVLMFLFIAVVPRPAREGDTWLKMGNWYNFFLHQYVAAFLATTNAAQLVWGLSGPATITSACQRIAAAVNDLRLNVGADGAVTLATSEQLHRIEGLNRYINELNKNQGLGFLLLRKRITFTLVMGLLIQTVSAMLVINTTLLSIVTVKEDVDEEEQGIEVANQGIEVANQVLLDYLQQDLMGSVQNLTSIVQALGLAEPKAGR